MSVTHLWQEEVRRADDAVVCSVTLELGNGERKQLWYEIPEKFEGCLTNGADPFVVGTVHVAMQEGNPVRVHGRVSPSLLQNIDEFQAAWSRWLHHLRRVEVTADCESESVAPDRTVQAVVAFSGGVDSCFSAFRHARPYDLRLPRKLTAGVMVHGFDIPLANPSVFGGAANRSGRLLSSLGLELITIRTNFREVVADWTHAYGAGISSCLMLLQQRFSEGLVAQGLAYDHYEHLPEGGNPLTDALLSSSSFRTVPDGAGYLRRDKIRAMSEWVEFRQFLRVCWQGPLKDRNCCKCEKCIRNILTFRALGLGLPPCFESDVSDEQVWGLWRLQEIVMRTQYDPLVEILDEAENRERWVKILKKRLNRNRKKSTSWLYYHGARLPYYGRRLVDRLRGSES